MVMAAIRYISARSADDNPWPVELGRASRPPSVRSPSSEQGTFIVPVENEQVMHVYEMHHVMAHLPGISWYTCHRYIVACFRKLFTHSSLRFSKFVSRQRTLKIDIFMKSVTARVSDDCIVFV